MNGQNNGGPIWPKTIAVHEKEEPTMRKQSVLTLLLVLLLALTLCACGGAAEAPAEAEESAETAETAEPAEEEEPETPAEGQTADGVSRLAAIYDRMDPKSGIHMNYDVYLDNLKATSRYDVHSKAGTYYARQSLLKDGYEDYDTIKFIQDGAFMTLHVKDKTGISVKGPSTDNIMITDSVYSAVQQCQGRDDFSAGQVEVDGITYDAEIFPVASVAPMEQTFCFDENGELALYIAAASEDYGTPEVKYTINVIDDAVDESLFDISGYTITEQ